MSARRSVLLEHRSSMLVSSLRREKISSSMPYRILGHVLIHQSVVHLVGVAALQSLASMMIAIAIVLVRVSILVGHVVRDCRWFAACRKQHREATPFIGGG